MNERDKLANYDRVVAENERLKKAMRTIVNSEEYHGDTVVCDFDSLQSVARAALAGEVTP